MLISRRRRSRAGHREIIMIAGMSGLNMPGMDRIGAVVRTAVFVKSLHRCLIVNMHDAHAIFVLREARSGASTTDSE